MGTAGGASLLFRSLWFVVLWQIIRDEWCLSHGWLMGNLGIIDAPIRRVQVRFLTQELTAKDGNTVLPCEPLGHLLSRDQIRDHLRSAAIKKEETGLIRDKEIRHGRFSGATLNSYATTTG